MRRRIVAATGVALVVLVAGCSGDAAPSAEPTRGPGPAEAYLEAALGVTPDGADRAAREMEESIARCMGEQGFEYLPYTGAYVAVDLQESDPPPGSREFAEQHGYGFAAAPEGMRPDVQAENPNDAITAAMSEAELEAYTAALWGEQDADVEGEPTVGGCFGAAREEVWDVDDPVRAALEAEIARIDAEVAPTDPAVVEAAAAWSGCMADAGHPGYVDPSAPEQEAWDAWVAFNDDVAADPAGGAEAAAGGGVVGQADLAAAEVALATADWDCRAAAGYDAVWREVRDRLQQEYVDAHRAELDAWVESSS